MVREVGVGTLPWDDIGVHRSSPAYLACSLGVLQYTLARPRLCSVLFGALDMDPAKKKRSAIIIDFFVIIVPLPWHFQVGHDGPGQIESVGSSKCC